MQEGFNYFEALDQLRKDYPELTFDNDGYENIPDEIRKANAEGNEKIEALLKETVHRFVRFQNFKPRKDGSFAVRCQTMWDDRFQGVTYLPLENFQPGHPSWEPEEQADAAFHRSI